MGNVSTHFDREEFACKYKKKDNDCQILKSLSTR